jgi:hypothetical protein
VNGIADPLLAGQCEAACPKSQGVIAGPDRAVVVYTNDSNVYATVQVD